MKKYILLYICILLFTISCKKDENPGTPGGGSVPILNSYPLKLGNEWKYHSTLSFISHTFNFFMNDYGTYRVDSLTSFGGYDSVFALIGIDSTDGGSIYLSTNYYFQNNSGLYSAGYIFTSNARVFLKDNNKHKFKLGNLTFNHIDEVYCFLKNPATDSLIIEYPALVTLKFPVVQNSVWTYRPYNNPIYIGKSYNGIEMVNTNFGNYYCQKVKFHYDLNNDGISDPEINIYQYVSPTKGLLKTSQEITILVTDNFGTVIDTGLHVQTSIATSINF